MGHRGAGLVLGLLLLPADHLARTTGDIDGRITDTTGAPYTIRQPPGYPNTLYNPEVAPERVNANYGKIVSRQEP